MSPLDELQESLTTELVNHLELPLEPVKAAVAQITAGWEVTYQRFNHPHLIAEQYVMVRMLRPVITLPCMLDTEAPTGC